LVVFRTLVAGHGFRWRVFRRFSFLPLFCCELFHLSPLCRAEALRPTSPSTFDKTNNATRSAPHECVTVPVRSRSHPLRSSPLPFLPVPFRFSRGQIVPNPPEAAPSFSRPLGPISGGPPLPTFPLLLNPQIPSPSPLASFFFLFRSDGSSFFLFRFRFKGPSLVFFSLPLAHRVYKVRFSPLHQTSDKRSLPQPEFFLFISAPFLPFGPK